MVRIVLFAILGSIMTVTYGQECTPEAVKCAEHFIMGECQAIKSATCVPIFVGCMVEKGINVPDSITKCQKNDPRDLQNPKVIFDSACRNPDVQDATKLLCCLCGNDIAQTSYEATRKAHDECAQVVKAHACNSN